MEFKITWQELFDNIESYKQSKDYLPIAHTIYEGYKIGSIEVEIHDYFEAKSIKEAKKYVKEYYTDIPDGIFTVVREETVFTEEDI